MKSLRQIWSTAPVSKLVAALSVALVLLTCSHASAAEPADGHAQILEERAAADSRYREAAAGSAAVVATAHTATTAFATCKNARLQILADGAIRRAEGARKVLEGGRRGTQALRRELEGRRVSLETERQALLRQYHGKTRDAAYAAGEQAYEDGMRERYLEPLDTVVQQVKDYGTGITAYAQVLEKYAAFCAQPGYSDGVGATFAKELASSVDAFAVQSAQFAKAVTDSRMSPDKAHAAAK